MLNLKSLFTTLLATQLLVANLGYAQSTSQRVVLTAGYQITQGSYNQNTNTTIQYIPISALYIKDKWQYELTIPYLIITGNGNIIPGTTGSMFTGGANNGGFGMNNGPMNNNQTSNTIVTNAGIGDVYARVAYSLGKNVNAKLHYELEINSKLGTADTKKSLGTGQNDYAIQLNSRYISSILSYVNIGYKVIGDSPTVNYNNVIYGSTGFNFNVGNTKRLGFAFDYQQTTLAGFDDFQQLSVSLSWVQDKKWSVSLAALAGLTNSSPDFGGSIYISNNY